MKKIIAILLIMLLCVSVIACNTVEESVNPHTEHTGFVEIVERKNLYYDPYTKVVYIIFNDTDTSYYQGYGYMSPYYAPNGLPYLFDVYSRTLYEIQYVQTNTNKPPDGKSVIGLERA